MIPFLLAAAAAILEVTLPPRAATPTTIEAVTLAPVFYRPFACIEHPEGVLPLVGDALGSDCLILGGMTDGANGYFRLFHGDGRSNADWYGWGADVHAPIDGVVKSIIINGVTNVPGHMGKPPAGMIVLERPDGLTVVLAHMTRFNVAQGDHVATGQIIAKVGNNGSARAPHIHIGAFRGREPLQIRWDLRAEGRVGSLVNG